VRSLILTAIGSVALAASFPALAHPTNGHRAQHEQLDQQHADVHDH